MPEYLHPGVYIEETSFRGKPIQGVSTSTAGFVGAARKGAEGKAIFVPSFAQFRRLFGYPVTAPAGLGDYLGHSVKSFFENGGARCYVVRVLAADALASSVAIEQGTALGLASGAVARLMQERLALLTVRQERPADLGKLSGREQHILDLVEQRMSNKQIARSLGLEVSTKKNHMHNIMVKLCVKNRREAAAMLRCGDIADLPRAAAGR
jgi:DNA-binding CsgD family transcriptional regulator